MSLGLLSWARWNRRVLSLDLKTASKEPPSTVSVSSRPQVLSERTYGRPSQFSCKVELAERWQTTKVPHTVVGFYVAIGAALWRRPWTWSPTFYEWTVSAVAALHHGGPGQMTWLEDPPPLLKPCVLLCFGIVWTDNKNVTISAISDRFSTFL